MLEHVPDSEFLFVETDRLELFYGNSKKEIGQLNNGYPESDLSETRKWIKKHKLNSTNTIDYLFQVTDLMRRFEAKELDPSTDYQGTVYSRILNSRDANIHIDCGRFTDFVSIFMLAEKIPFRRIDAHYIPDTAIGAHSFQEIYIKEKDQWAFVDLTNDKILLQHNNGNYVTVKDVYERIGKKDYDNIGIYSYQKKNRTPIPWKDNIVEEHKCFVPSIMLLYYNMSLEKAYHGYGLKKRRYLFTDWVTLFNPRDRRSNLPYYVRNILLYTGLLLTFLSVLLFLKRKF